MIFTNQTLFSPTTYELVCYLYQHKIRIILVGSEAGQFYGLCDSSKDIDFVLDTSSQNMQNFYNLMNKHFNIKYEQFISLNKITIQTKEKKYIEFIKTSSFISYDTLNINKQQAKLVDCIVDIIGIEDYINSTTRILNYYKNSKNQNKNLVKKIQKYHTILNNYNNSIQPSISTNHRDPIIVFYQ